MSSTCILLLELGGGIVLFAAIFLWFRFGLKKISDTFPMDPAQQDAHINQVQGGFEPHLKRYQELAQLVLTLATATVAFLMNFLTGIHPEEKRSVYSLRLESASRSAIVFLGLSAIFAIAFILGENLAYETYCHHARRDTYTAQSYALNLALGYSGIACFLFAYAYLAFRLFE
jgi:hypothetical protein